MRTEEEIDDMKWLLSGDPDSDKFNQVLSDHIKREPTQDEADEYLRIVDDAVVLGIVENLKLAVMQLEILVWLMNDEELLMQVHAIPLEGYDSLIAKGLVIKDGISFEEEE